MKYSRLLIWLLVLAGSISSVRGNGAYENRANIAQATADSIIAPNVFTPNGDDKNDIFEVTASNGETVTLKIFTRAGTLVFSITAKRCRWDGCLQSGEKMAEGIYYYTAEVSGSSPKISKNGFVHLFR
ncbi:MAG: gliding motility-associated C-terminal domain-containing protein [Bacteroidales bacterium]|jgi:gliding motility-associated-like protein|nr:gliding motility-associated C-terminal domain-containing protein [Bacteroidales bacterium]